MKKGIALLLACALVFALCACTPKAAPEPTLAPTPDIPADPALYIPTVKAATAATSPMNDSMNTGLLYDLDGDGAEELILTYDNGDGALLAACYTIRNGEVTPLLPPTQLCVMAGGAMGYIGAAEVGGETCLVLYALPDIEAYVPDSSEDGFYESGWWKVFTLADGALQEQSDVTFYSVWALAADDGPNTLLAGQSSYVINGEAADYDAYAAFADSIHPIACSYGFKFDGLEHDAALTIPELLAELGEEIGT